MWGCERHHHDGAGDHLHGSGDDDHRDVDDFYDGSDAAQAPDGLPIDVW